MKRTIVRNSNEKQVMSTKARNSNVVSVQNYNKLKTLELSSRKK